MLISGNMSSPERVSQPAGSDRQIVVLENAPPGRHTQRRTALAIDDQAAYCGREGSGGGNGTIANDVDGHEWGVPRRTRRGARPG